MRPVYITGKALWTPGYASVQAWMNQQRSEEVTRPQCAIANSRLLRGTSLLTRLLVEVAEHAGRDAGVDLSGTPSIFASAFGEVQIAKMQMDMWRTGDGHVSPHRFKNSVHNTGAGVFSIAAKNQCFTTALAGGDQTVAMALLEGVGLLTSGVDSVIVAVGEEPIPTPFDHEHTYEALGAGFVLSHRAPQAGGMSFVDLGPTSDDAPMALPSQFQSHPCAAALQLVERLERRENGSVRLTNLGQSHWSLTLQS